MDKAKQTRDGRLNAYDSLDARKTALVVVDMQNYFVADGMPACAPEARTITCKVLSEDKIAIKYRYSVFIPYPSELDDLLRTHGIHTLLVTGVATSTCCESTARDAAMCGYRTIMVSDGNADQTDALHNHTLGKFLVTFGDVQAIDDLLATLGSA